jgi:hypothetical protein
MRPFKVQSWAPLLAPRVSSPKSRYLGLGGPNGPIFGGSLFNQRADQLQQRVMFWTLRAARQKSANLDERWFTTGGNVRFMQDEYSPRGLAAEIPRVSICAAVELSSLNVHVWAFWCTNQRLGP